MRARVAALLVALVVAGGGCDRGNDEASGTTTTAAGGTTTTTAAGGGGDASTTTTTAAGGTTTTAAGRGGTSTTTAAGAAGDLGLGDVVLRQGDFPPGWTSEPSDDRDDEEADAALRRCLGLEVGTAGRPEARSPDFSVGDAITQARSSVERAPDMATVDREYAAITGPRFLDCATRQFDAAIAREAAGAQFAPAKAARLPFPAYGDGTAAVRLTTTLSAEGQQLPFAADLVFVRKGLLEMSFSFIDAGGPFDAGLAADLVGKVVARA